MSSSKNTHLPPVDLRSAVREYAARLLSTFDQQIGIISETADPTSREVYQSASLRPEDPRKHTDWKSDQFQAGFEQDASPSPAPPVLESKLLQEWREEGYQKPLLIVAPVGSGKSCLLESFGLRMAKDLLDETLWPESQPLPIAVPVVISLSKMQSTPLNQYLTRAEIDITQDSDASLKPEHLQYLHEQRRLVLLIDGFDEAPSAHKKLAKQLPKWEGRFALTSRPGHGAGAIVPDLERQRTLEELTEIIARKYVLSYFTTRQCLGKSKEQIEQELFIPAWKTHFGRLLRRPLYLKSWCDFVWKQHGNDTPKSMGQLAHQLFLKTLKSRNQFKPLLEETEERQRAVKGFQEWFGALGLHFARNGFRAEESKELVRLGLFGKKNSKLKALDETYSYETVALQCGLLTRDPDLDLYFLPKVPLTEYLIGKSLADDAIHHPDSPQVLIETFRKWIWQPDLHDILDYTFDALWHSSDPRMTLWGNELLSWAKGVGRQDATRSHHGLEQTQEDLLHPFSRAVLRWRMLDSRERNRECLEDLTEFVQATLPAIKNGVSFTDLVGDHRVVEEFFVPLVMALIAQHRRAEGDLDAQRGWRWAIRSAAGRVSESSAAKVVSQWIAQHRLAEEDPAAQQAWREAIRSAAGRVSESSAAEVVSELIEQYRLAEEDPAAQQIWRWAIWNAADRVSESSAAEVVSQWIAQHRQAKGDPVAQAAWRWAIWSAAGRVSESSAAEVVSQWIEQHRLAEEDADAQETRRWAIRNAAGRVSESSAAEVVSELIEQYRLAEEDPATQLAWREAIRSATDRVSESSAAEVVSLLIEQYRLAKGDPDAQQDWQEAIESAAGRVCESSAAEVVSELIEQYRLAEEDPAAQQIWRWAIWNAAGRVSESSAAKVVSLWIEQYRLAEGDSTAQKAWREAIWSAADRVSESSAAEVVSQMIEQHRLAKGDPAAQEAWRSAIRSAAGRVSESSAAEVVSQMIEQHQLAEGDPTAQQSWKEAIGRTAQRVRDDANAERESSVVRVCGQLMKIEMQDLAFRVAVNNPSIAMVSVRTDNPQLTDAETTPAVSYHAVLRKNQILDEKLFVAPPVVRCVFIEHLLDELEAKVFKNGLPSEVAK